MKKILLLFAILILSCSKDKITNDVVVIDDIDIGVPTNLFNHETYSQINQTVGNITKRQNTQRFISKDELIDEYSVMINNRMYWNVPKSSVQYDFFGDGKVDYFGFNHFDCEAQLGVYILIEDINDNPKEPIIFESKLASSSSATLDDIDNDGFPEVLFYSINNHGFYNCNTNIENLEPIVRVKINQDKTITESNLNNTPISLHDGTSGDIDNDGDIDIIAWPSDTTYGTTFPNLNLPIKIINDGNGNFSELPLFNDEHILLDEGIVYWYFSSYQLMDLNNDGILDLVGGNMIASIGDFANADLDYFDIRKHLVTPKLIIFWGSSDGFYYKDATYLDSATNLETELYGFLFTDYNNDGLLDMMVNSIINRETGQIADDNTFYIDFYKNNGNGQFTNVTNDIFDVYQYLGGNQYTNFYTPISVDYDNDGDFDIVVGDFHYHSITVNYPKLWYWENINEKFYIKRVE